MTPNLAEFYRNVETVFWLEDLILREFLKTYLHKKFVPVKFILINIIILYYWFITISLFLITQIPLKDKNWIWKKWPYFKNLQKNRRTQTAKIFKNQEKLLKIPLQLIRLIKFIENSNLFLKVKYNVWK